MARPIANPITYGTLSGNVPMSDLDTSFGALFTTGFNDSSLGWVNYVADTGTANAYAVTLSVTPSSYTAGMCVAFTPQNTNTGTSTINVNALGTKTIVTAAGAVTLSGGEIEQTILCVLVYDGTNFRIATPCPFSNSLGTVTTNQTINLAGYSSLMTIIILNAAAITLTLNNVFAGIPINIKVANTSGSNATLKMTATNPAGTAFTSIAALSGGTSTDMIATGVTLSNGVHRMLVGSATNGLNMQLGFI